MCVIKLGSVACRLVRESQYVTRLRAVSIDVIVRMYIKVYYRQLY